MRLTEKNLLPKVLISALVSLLCIQQVGHSAIQSAIPSAYNGWNMTNVANNEASFIMDAAGEEVGFIFQAPATGTITKISYKTGTVTTSQSLQIGIYTVDGSGDPTTTAYGGMADAVQATSASDTAYQVTLATPATAVQGDVVAVRIYWTSTAGSLRIIGSAGNISDFTSGSTAHSFPYTNLKAGAGPAWSHSARSPKFAVVYSDNSFYYTGGNYTNATVPTAQAIDSTTTPDEVGLKFTPAFKARLKGAYVRIVPPPASTFDLVLYDSADGVLETLTVDGDQSGNTSSSTHYFIFDTSVTLTAGSIYRLVVKPTATALSVYYHTINNDEFPANGLELDFIHTQRTDAGAWTDTSTQFPMISIVFDGFDDAVSAGGSTDLLGVIQ